MSGDQISSLPGKKRIQMPGVCPGGDVEASIWLVHNMCIIWRARTVNVWVWPNGWNIRLMKGLFSKRLELTKLSTFLWTIFASKVYAKRYTASLFICLSLEIIPAVLSNLASCGWHLLLIISSHLFPWAGFRGHTILPLHWCLRVPSADRVNCMNGWSQGFVLVSTRIVPSGGRHFPLWGLIHMPLACKRGVGAEGCAANQ